MTTGARDALRPRARRWLAPFGGQRDTIDATPPEPVAPPGDPACMERELQALAPDERLFESERFEVVAAQAWRIPALLDEIGRLREISFRAVGEGTGRARDLDAFDRHYLHLVVWDRGEGRPVGASRLAASDRVLPVFGAQGLYTATLFHYRDAFFSRLGPAWELGRSFVRPEYQRSSSALLLLWKGIARLVARDPRRRMLFGAVSISDRYTPRARALLARHLLRWNGAPELAGQASPRRPFRVAWSERAALAARVDSLATPADLSRAISELEPDGKGLPVLVREYLKLGGRFVAASLDPSFGNVLDALVVVDLAAAERRLLGFYLGRQEAARFLAFHGLASDAAA
jgi:putative hemolysin